MEDTTQSNGVTHGSRSGRTSRKPAAARLRCALSTAAEWHEVGSVEALRSLALPAWRDLLGVDAASWNELDLSAGKFQLWSAPADATFMKDVSLLEALSSQHPLDQDLADLCGQPRSLWDGMAHRRSGGVQGCRDLFRPAGISRQLAFVFSRSPLLVLAVNGRRDDFSAADHELAQLLGAHLRAAYTAVAARVLDRKRIAALERGLDERGGAVAVVRTDGSVEHASPRAAELLGRWFAWGDRARLPSALAEGGERTFERPDARLHVCYLSGEPALVLLDETRLAPDDDRLRAHGLTDREREVVAAVARGLTNAQIGAELIISKRTVEKHLEHARQKLGVSDRDAVVDLLLSRTAGRASRGRPRAAAAT